MQCCRGELCQTLLDEMSAAQRVFLETHVGEIGPGDEIRIDRQQFCATLRSRKPATCPANPPQVPGINGLTFATYRDSIAENCSGGAFSALDSQSMQTCMGFVESYTGHVRLAGPNFYAAAAERMVCALHDRDLADNGCGS